MKINFDLLEILSQKFTASSKKVAHKKGKRKAVKPDFATSPYYKPSSIAKMEKYKAECIEALNAEKPTGRVLVIDEETKDLIEKFDGTPDSSQVPIQSLRQGYPIRIMHGHVEVEKGVALPVSLQDFGLMNENNDITEVVAYRKDGKFSLLRKTEDFKPLDPNNYKEFKKMYISYILRNSNKEKQQELKALIDKYKWKYDEHKNAEKLFLDEITKLQNTKSGAKAIDIFWKKFAALFNLKYIPYEV